MLPQVEFNDKNGRKKLVFSKFEKNLRKPGENFQKTYFNSVTSIVKIFLNVNAFTLQSKNIWCSFKSSHLG